MLNWTACFVFEASAGENAGKRWASNVSDDSSFLCRFFFFFFFLMRIGEGSAELIGANRRSKGVGGRDQAERKKATVFFDRAGGREAESGLVGLGA